MDHRSTYLRAQQICRMHFLINESTISKMYEVPTDLDNLNKASTISGKKAEAGEKEEEEVEEKEEERRRRSRK